MVICIPLDKLYCIVSWLQYLDEFCSDINLTDGFVVNIKEHIFGQTEY